jgi:hypothetical protein
MSEKLSPLGLEVTQFMHELSKEDPQIAESVGELVHLEQQGTPPQVTSAARENGNTFEDIYPTKIAA